MRTFELIDDTSNKFWNIDLQGTSFTTNYGKIGTKGQTQTKSFPTEEKALNAYTKLIQEKLGKGYTETTPKQTVAISPIQQALEKTLVENPDDLASHSAYADYLMEQGDPRGEFIQIQLALEDPSRSVTERQELRDRESYLLKLHGNTWIGDAARFLVHKESGEKKPYHYRFTRGWLDTVRTLPIPQALFPALSKSPEARLLRQLEVIYDMEYHPFDFDPFIKAAGGQMNEDEEEGEMYESVEILPPLLDSPYLSNLRVFKIGFDGGDRVGYSTMVQPFDNITVDQIIQLFAKCPKLEELYLNTHVSKIKKLFALPALGQLRVFQYYFGSEYDSSERTREAYPLTELANNKALNRITTLQFHAGRDTTIDVEEMDALLRSPNLPNLTRLQIRLTEFGDEGARRVVESGVLKKLKSLDLGYGNMTDEGARILASSPDLKHLELLDLTKNALTKTGIAALKATGVRLIAEEQHTLDENDYLYEVDFE